MLTSKLLHPQMLNALGKMGHGSTILIADGNFPFGTHTNPAAEHVYLNLRVGLATVTDVLETLVGTIPVEAAHVMQPGDGSTPPIFAEFEAMLPELSLERVERFAFYDRVLKAHAIVLTGEPQPYANFVFKKGVIGEALVH